MKLEVLRGRELIREVLKDRKVIDLTYLLNRESLYVEYLLLYVESGADSKLILVDYGRGDREISEDLELILKGSEDFNSAVESINRNGKFVCVDPEETDAESLMEPDRDIAVVSERLFQEVVPEGGLININLVELFSHNLSAEEIREALKSDEVDSINELLLGDDVVIDMDTLEEVLSTCEGYNREALEIFLGHVLFRLMDESDSRELYEIFMERAEETEDRELKRIFMEKALYAYARLVNSDGGEDYEYLKSMLDEYIEGETSSEDTAFTIYEVITSLRTENVEILRDMLFSFDRYIPYTEEFSPLIFGDLGMSFYAKWEDSGNQEYRELSMILLQKSLFSVKELLRLGKTHDIPINLSNFFAYISVLIPLLSEEVENSHSPEVQDAKVLDIKESLCLGLQLFLDFSGGVSVENFTQVYPTEEEARIMVESTFENFISMMESYFDSGVESESEEIWDEVVSSNPSYDELIEGALKVSEILCPGR